MAKKRAIITPNSIICMDKGTKIMIKFFLIILLISSQIQAFNVDSLLIKSVGGQEAYTQLEELKSFSVEGTVNFNGSPGTFIEYFEKPNKLYLELKLSGMTLIQSYDGCTAWQQDHNGRVSELSGFERQALMTSIYMESSAYFFPERIPGEYEYLGDTVINENSYHQVAFYPLHEDTVKVLFDKKTGMRRMIIDKMDHITSVTEYSDFRKTSEILFPFHLNIIYLGTPMLVEFNVDSMNTNSDIDDNIFQIPGVEISDFRFNTSDDNVTIPIEYKYDHIWLSASLNGNKKVWFILDSGASANFFNSKVIADLDLEITGTMPVVGIAGFDEVQLVKTDSISIGSLVLLDQIAGAMDLTEFEKILSVDREFGGILGHDFLSRFPIMVDYQNSELTIYNPANFIPPAEGHEVPFKLTMLVPTIEAEIEGIKGDFIVDLGNSFGLVLHNQFFDRHGLDNLLDNISTNTGTFGGIGGKLESKSGRAGHFKFGDLILEDIEVLIPFRGEGLSGSSQLAGNIGNQLLKRYKVLFDYGNNMLVFYDNE